MKVNLSPLVLIFLSSLTVLATGIGVLQYFLPASSFALQRAEGLAVAAREAPFLGMLRDEQGKLFVSGKMERQPWLHGVGHVLPAALWTFCIPLQHSIYLRNRYRKVHRIAGRVILLSALPLAITPLFFKSAGIFFTHQDIWHLHRPFAALAMAPTTPHWLRRPLAMFAWPTAEVWLHLGSSVLLLTTYKTIKTARAGHIVDHKKWATMHTLMGLTVHIERFLIGVVAFVGWIIDTYFTESAKRALGIPEDSKDFSRGEMAAFAFTLWAAAGVTLPWALLMWKALSAPQTSSKSTANKGKSD